MQAFLSAGFSRQEYWGGCRFLLQEIFPTQGLNWGLLHCRQIHYQLSYQGSPMGKEIHKANAKHYTEEYIDFLSYDSWSLRKPEKSTF